MKCKLQMLRLLCATLLISISLFASLISAQTEADLEPAAPASLFDNPARWLVNMPTAGTLLRGNYEIGAAWYSEGGAIGHTDIGLSNRLLLGISFGGEEIVSNADPKWNPGVEFNAKFRVIDEDQYFPAVTAGFSSQGFGAYNKEYKRYTFKSRGFYGVVSRSFYFYEWTAGWHAGVNYSLENKIDKESDVNFFAGLDATFKYNLALLLEWDAALNDNNLKLPDGTAYGFAGKGRGYMNLGVRWLYNNNLELEVHLLDLLGNRRDFKTFGREIKVTYIGSF
jgi:hypothetical protein